LGHNRKKTGLGVTPYNLRSCVYLKEFEKEKIDLVDKILAIIKGSTCIPACDSNATDKNVCATVREYERQIDQMVYKLYDLTDEEIKIIESFNNPV